MSKFTVDIETAQKVRHWWNEGRGVTLWRSIDLNCVADSWITPTDSGQPSWRAGNPSPLWPHETPVETRKRVTLPPAGFPVCEMCQGSGIHTIGKLATMRGESVADTLRKIKEGDISIVGKIGENDTFPCNVCSGTGHVVTYPNVRVTRLPPYKGGGIHFQSAKVDKMAAKLGVNVKWDIDYAIGYGLAKVYFYTVDVTTLDKIL